MNGPTKKELDLYVNTGELPKKQSVKSIVLDLIFVGIFLVALIIIWKY